MNPIAKRLIAFTFLFAFLNPLISESLHAFAHADDFHCTQLNEYHFHELEHKCVLCDLNVSVSENNIPVYYNFILSCSFFSHSNSPENFSQLTDFNSHFLRGPPTC